MTFLKPLTAAIAVCGAMSSTGAIAQDITIKPIAEARLRYEHVEQDGIDQDTDALTVRVRGGVDASFGVFSATVVAQGNLSILDHYDDGVSGQTSRSIVADPQNIALMIAQLQYRSEGVSLTAGRQNIMLDDERFVGHIAFRNNAQTFDAVRAQFFPAKELNLGIAYVWGVRTIWGMNGKGARQQAVSGDTVLTNVNWQSPIGKLTGFAYLVDQDEMAVQSYGLSSQTYGVRLAGVQKFSDAASLAYQASYARQSDWHRNPNSYKADYWLADGTLNVKGWKVHAGYEVLGAAGGLPLTSFQTPLGTNLKFQGWADKFLTTPPNGLRDLYLGGGYGVKKMGQLSAVTLQLMWHQFDSDRLHQHYGNEVNALVSAKWQKITVAVRYAHYEAKSLNTDTDKVWVQFDWAM